MHLHLSVLQILRYTNKVHPGLLNHFHLIRLDNSAACRSEIINCTNPGASFLSELVAKKTHAFVDWLFSSLLIPSESLKENSDSCKPVRRDNRLASTDVIGIVVSLQQALHSFSMHGRRLPITRPINQST